MQTTNVIRPEGRQAHTPIRSYAVGQLQPLIGRTVEIRDWYATFRATVDDLVVSERTGFVAGLALTYEDGRSTPHFSLNCTREIAP